MAKTKAGGRGGNRGGRRRGSCLGAAWRAAGALLALIVVVPVAQVGCVRYVDPPLSTMMGQRWVEAMLDERRPPPLRHQWLALDQAPDEFLRMLLVSEDARFFAHDGFDWIEIEAAWRDWRERGKPLRGASTVSMQCARSLFLWQGWPHARKPLEVYYTLLMERILGKRRILELYINHIEMGDGVYGLAAAARSHFQRAPAELATGQLACLAAMLPNPRHWNPATPPPALAARRDRILRRLPAMRLPEDL